MWPRLTIAAITLFFITMNVLLWRSEIVGQRTLAVPPRVVWKRILENEHKPNFEIRYNGTTVGSCTWATIIQTEPISDFLASDGAPVEGMAQKRSGYEIDFDGRFSLEQSIRLQFAFELRLKTEQEWEQFTLRLRMRPESWEVHASAKTQEIRFITEDERNRTERAFKFADLQNPDRILREFGGPFFPELLNAMGLRFSPEQFEGTSLGFSWEAWTDSLEIRNLQIPVYRVQGRFLDRVQVVVQVRRADGEILRVDLPNNVVLLNHTLAQL